MTFSKNPLEQLKHQTGTTCYKLTQPHDQLKDLAKKALLVKTTDDTLIGHRICFSFIITKIDPLYKKATDREMLINNYLRVLNNSSESIEEITIQKFLEECSNKFAMKDFILIADRSSYVLEIE